MFRPDIRHAPPQDPETRQRELVGAYQESLRSFLAESEEAMRQTTEAHSTGVTAWTDEAVGQRRFERVLENTTEEVQNLSDITASGIEGLLGEMHDRVVGTLSADDRRLLQEAMRVAKEEGASSYKVGNVLRKGSSYAAQEALDAAMDGARLRYARRVAKEEGASSYKVGNVTGSGSSYAAQQALDAAMDGTRLRYARKVAGEEGASSYKVDNVIGSGSSYAAQNALDAALDGDRFRQAKAVAAENGKESYKVGNVTRSASTHWVGEAMGIAVNIEDVTIPKIARKLGRQAFKNVFSRWKRPKEEEKAEQEYEIPPDYEDMFEDFFRRWGFDSGHGGFHDRDSHTGQSHSGQSHSGQSHSGRTHSGGGPHSDGRSYEAPPPPRQPSEPNPYEILGVERDATEQDIKRAYRKLAREHHPDLNGGEQPDEEKMKAINNAYDTLGDPEARAHYDQFGTTRGF